jgi:hypothetical protein
MIIAKVVTVVVFISVVLFIESRVVLAFGEYINVFMVALKIFYLLEREEVL